MAMFDFPGFSPASLERAMRSTAGGETVDVLNPATGEPVGTVPWSGRSDAAAAVDRAAQAFPLWRSRTAGARAGVLRRWYDLILVHQADLAALLTAEQGKPLTESMGEIRYAAAFVEWFAEEAKRIYGDVIPGHETDKRLMVLKQPVGVVCAITPWNFPAAMITRKVGPALAAGCTVLVKPATQTPLTAFALAALAYEAGVPDDAFQVLAGPAPELADEFADRPEVRKISFTGSTDVGRKLMARSAAGLKKLSLELGGNAPFIVFDDADLDAAVEGAIASKYRNSGQTCVCANRFIVQAGIHDRFAQALAARVGTLKVGNGAHDGVLQGPLIDQKAVAKVQEHVADALAGGALVITGGGRHAAGGTFFEPTVLTGARPDMLIAREETFGPVAALFRFETEDEAIALANDTEFGLAAYFYSRDLGRVWRVAEALEVGIVGVNTGLISTERAPFGGVKQSGFGREGSRYGIEDYLEIKYLCLSV